MQAPLGPQLFYGWRRKYFQPLESLIRDKEQKGAESSKLAHYDVYTLTEPALQAQLSQDTGYRQGKKL